MELELTIFDCILPVNTLAVLKRIEQILKENETNSAFLLRGEALARVQACILLLVEQAKMHYDILYEWKRLKEELKPAKIASELKP
jgi:hypothetical protein